jgi:hypothetical protein
MHLSHQQVRLLPFATTSNRFLAKNVDRYPIWLMCRALNVSSAGNYAWVDRPKSPRTLANHGLLVEIRSIHRASRETYGSPSIWREFRKRVDFRGLIGKKVSILSILLSTNQVTK